MKIDLNYIIEKYGRMCRFYSEQPGIIKMERQGSLKSQDALLFKAFNLLDCLRDDPQVLADFNHSQKQLDAVIIHLRDNFTEIFSLDYLDKLKESQNYYIDKNCDIYTAMLIDNLN